MRELCIGEPGRRSKTYRAEWIEARGPISADTHLHHRCGNAWCVNLDHLQPVTPREHGLIHSPASRTHCTHGHEYTPENTYRTREGWRHCRACNRRNASAFNARRDRQTPNGLKTHCPHGHEYTPENTIHSAGQGRKCRTCKRERDRLRSV